VVERRGSNDPQLHVGCLMLLALSRSVGLRRMAAMKPLLGRSQAHSAWPGCALLCRPRWPVLLAAVVMGPILMRVGPGTDRLLAAPPFGLIDGKPCSRGC